MQENAEPARQLAKSGETGVALLGDDRGQQPLALDLEDIGHLRGEHIIGPGVLGLGDQLRGSVEIALRGKARAHLHEPGDKRKRPAHDLVPPAAINLSASKLSSWPARSSADRSSKPPTWVEPMKIWGTVMRPFARITISLRRLASPLTSISVNSAPLRDNSRLAAWQ